MNAKSDMHNLGIKLGAIFGITLLSLALLSMAFGIGGPIIALLASLYKGYAATFMGAIIGLFLGFIHGYVVGALVIIFKKYLPKL